MGIHDDPIKIINYLKKLRAKAEIDYHTSIIFNTN